MSGRTDRILERRSRRSNWVAERNAECVGYGRSNGQADHDGEDEAGPFSRFASAEVGIAVVARDAGVY